MSTIPVLELVVHLANGMSHRYATTVQADAAKVLDAFRSPDRFFHLGELYIGDGKSLNVIPRRDIVRIDLLGDNLPKWPQVGDALSVMELIDFAFDGDFDLDAYKAHRQEAWDQPGRSQVGFTQIDTADGATVVWEVVMKSRDMLPLDLQRYISNILSAGALTGQRARGGLMIINPAMIHRMRFIPGPPVLGPSMWKMDGAG